MEDQATPPMPGGMPPPSPVTETPQTAGSSTHHMAGNQTDMLVQLFRDMEQARREERVEAERIRQEDKAEERHRFNALIAAITPQQHQLQQQGVQAGNPQVVGLSPVTTPQVTPTTSLPKAAVQPPPALLQDVTLRQFKDWKQQWDDYAIMVDLHSLPQPKQLVQLRSSLSAEMRRTLEVSLGVAPDSTLTLMEVMNLLHDFVRAQKNEALRRLTFSQCKQAEGEKFIDFYVRLKQAADEVDLCKGHDAACVETQMKHAVLIGVCDEETKQRLLELKSDATLDQVKTVCRSHEAAETTTLELRPQQVAARAVSAYKKQKKQPKQQGKQNGSPKTANRHSKPRQSGERCGKCGYVHAKGKCPADGEKCRKCDKVGHFASQCRSNEAANMTKHGGVWSVMRAEPSSTAQVGLCAIEDVSFIGPPSPSIKLQVRVGAKSVCTSSIPDTGADTTVMG